jgi:hypothetical protein
MFFKSFANTVGCYFVNVAHLFKMPPEVTHHPVVTNSQDIQEGCPMNMHRDNL